MQRGAPLKWSLGIFALIYSIAASLAVVLFLQGLGEEPLLALPAMFLGMPWSLLTDTLVGQGFARDSLLLTAPLLLNGAILWGLFLWVKRRR